MNVKELYESLKMTNNGYLFAPLPEELAAAKAFPSKFTVLGGSVVFPFASGELVKYKGGVAKVMGLSMGDFGVEGFKVKLEDGSVEVVSSFLLEKIFL